MSWQKNRVDPTQAPSDGGGICPGVDFQLHDQAPSAPSGCRTNSGECGDGAEHSGAGSTVQRESSLLSGQPVGRSDAAGYRRGAGGAQSAGAVQGAMSAIAPSWGCQTRWPRYFEEPIKTQPRPRSPCSGSCSVAGWGSGSAAVRCTINAPAPWRSPCPLARSSSTTWAFSSWRLSWRMTRPARSLKKSVQ